MERHKYFLFNDPKYDEYALPLPWLLKCRELFKKGATLEQIRVQLLVDMERMVKNKPQLLDKLPVMKLPPDERQVIIGVRIMMADPTSEEYPQLVKLRTRFRGRKHEKRNWDTILARRRKIYHQTKEQRKTPEYRERQKKYQRDWYQRIKTEDPLRHRKMLEAYRRRRAKDKEDPVKLAKLKASARKASEKRQHRMATDPQYRKEECRKRNERYRKRKQLANQ